MGRTLIKMDDDKVCQVWRCLACGETIMTKTPVFLSHCGIEMTYEGTYVDKQNIVVFQEDDNKTIDIMLDEPATITYIGYDQCGESVKKIKLPGFNKKVKVGITQIDHPGGDNVKEIINEL